MGEWAALRMADRAWTAWVRGLALQYLAELDVYATRRAARNRLIDETTWERGLPHAELVATQNEAPSPAHRLHMAMRCDLDESGELVYHGASPRRGTRYAWVIEPPEVHNPHVEWTLAEAGWWIVLAHAWIETKPARRIITTEALDAGIETERERFGRQWLWGDSLERFEKSVDSPYNGRETRLRVAQAEEMLVREWDRMSRPASTSSGDRSAPPSAKRRKCGTRGRGTRPLTDREREVVQLRDGSHFTFQEIADKLGWKSAGGAYRAYQRGRKLLGRGTSKSVRASRTLMDHDGVRGVEADDLD